MNRTRFEYSFTQKVHRKLTLILLTWRIWRVRNNANKWQMGFNSAFKGLNSALKFHGKLSGIDVLYEVGDKEINETISY